MTHIPYSEAKRIVDDAFENGAAILLEDYRRNHKIGSLAEWELSQSELEISFKHGVEYGLRIALELFYQRLLK